MQSFSPGIHYVHSPVYTEGGKGLDALYGLGTYFRQSFLFFRGQFSEDKIDLPSTAEIVAYSYTQARIVLRSEHFRDVGKPVMPAGTASIA